MSVPISILVQADAEMVQALAAAAQIKGIAPK